MGCGNSACGSAAKSGSQPKSQKNQIAKNPDRKKIQTAKNYARATGS